jgi:hypothetical protein
MADTELLRTFVAIYRAGTLTDAACHRGISQPAASQHLSALESTIGTRLFVRGPGGVVPTQRARELYAQVTEPLDALEEVIRGLRAEGPLFPSPPVRFGSSPEYFAAEVIPLLAETGIAVTATFGTAARLTSPLPAPPRLGGPFALHPSAASGSRSWAPRPWHLLPHSGRWRSCRTGFRPNRGLRSASNCLSRAAFGKRRSVAPSQHSPGWSLRT